METRKQMILAALDAFVRQRSGMDWRNYITPGGPDERGRAAYRADARSITRNLHDYRALKRTVELRDSITADDLVAAFRDAYSGRLTLIDISDHNTVAYDLDYCAGQYFPTEYRKAACAVLASALWARKREDMPPVVGYRVESWTRYGENYKSLGRERSKVIPTRDAAEALLAEKGGRDYGSVNEIYPDNLSPGDWLRASFRKEFGRGIASRWFS